MTFDQLINTDYSELLPADTGVRSVEALEKAYHNSHCGWDCSDGLWDLEDLRWYTTLADDQTIATVALEFVTDFACRVKHRVHGDPARVILTAILPPVEPMKTIDGKSYWHRDDLKSMFWQVYDMLMQARSRNDAVRGDIIDGYYQRAVASVAAIRAAGGHTAQLGCAAGSVQ